MCLIKNEYICPGLISFLINNGVPGLQVERDGQWFAADVPLNSIMVNVDDHLEVTLAIFR